MADNPVQLAELQAMADYFTTAEYPYFEELREAFQLLRKTGCRIQEIFDITRWNIISGYQVSVQPQKGNNLRYITLDNSVDNFITAISGQYSPFLGRTYSQLQNLFSRINPYGKIYSGTKEITNYFFRYLFVRELADSGLSVEQIANVMGYTSTQAVANYLNANLSSTIEVPVEPGGSIVFNDVEYPFISIGNMNVLAKPLIWTDAGEGFFYPDNNPANAPEFGVLYTHHASQRLQSSLPPTWRIPSESDFLYLRDELIPNGSFMPQAASNNPIHWDTVANKTNSSGLTMRGSGYLSYGIPRYFKFTTTFWTTTPAGSFIRTYGIQSNNMNLIANYMRIATNWATSCIIVSNT